MFGAGDMTATPFLMEIEMERQTTRAEHLAWCKQRALEFLPGDPQQAFASMASDLNKHDETRGHAGMEIGMGLMRAGCLGDMRKFIEGFN